MARLGVYFDEQLVKLNDSVVKGKMNSIWALLRFIGIFKINSVDPERLHCMMCRVQIRNGKTQMTCLLMGATLRTQ